MFLYLKLKIQLIFSVFEFFETLLVSFSFTNGMNLVFFFSSSLAGNSLFGESLPIQRCSPEGYDSHDGTNVQA